MPYDNTKDRYDNTEGRHRTGSGSTKYYLNDSEKIEDPKELPTFRQIFHDTPKSGSIASFSEFHQGVIYFSSMDTHAYAVNADTGELAWKFKTGAPTMSTPLVHHNCVYFGSTDGYFYCLDLKERNVVWTFQTGFGLSDSFQDKIDEIKNTFIEYDRKIFRVWVPETAARGPAQINVADYAAKLGVDSAFKYGGIGSYLSKGSKKKDPYRG